jgi:dephospho-CoA kinase
VTQRAPRIGLTGGIGSGKSTVASMLAQLGARVVDADAIARNCSGPDGGAVNALAQAFGSNILTAAGALDREKMRNLAFSQPDARRRLEEILHPLVRREMLLQADAAERDGVTSIVLDIPLLVEAGTWRQHLDRVLVVDCSKATQISRVLGRSAISVPVIEQIMESQVPRLMRLAAADMVICNEELSLEQLRASVQELAPHFGL